MGEKGSTFSILKDREFDASRKVLNGKAIELQEQGLGKRKHRADPVTEEEEELLWSRQVLGADTALNLNLTDQSAVWHSGMPRTSSAEGRTLEVCQQPLYWYH